MGAHMAVTILVTAFGSFPGARANPTIAILRAVERDWGRAFARAGFELRTASLPVVYEGAEARVQALIAQMRPHVVLHLGLAARRSKLSFEACARNRLSVLHRDGAGARSGRMILAPQGPMVRRARAPLARVLAAMASSGAACALSRDAGDYLCNQTFYASLATAAPCVGFLHVPRPRNLARPRVKASLCKTQGKAQTPTVRQACAATAKAMWVLSRYSTMFNTVFLPEES
jgi:pyroglutamyl-peptidase